LAADSPASVEQLGPGSGELINVYRR